MRIWARIKLLFGFVLVVLLCGALTVWLDVRHSEASSETAEIRAESFTVGIDYSGLITEQFVEEGDTVKEGQDLFRVRSTSLRERMTELQLKESELLYPLSEEGEIMIKATRPGLVSSIKYKKGSFVPANEEIATIIDQTSLQVAAKYRLARRDFSKLSTEAELDVRLPDGNWTKGEIRNIEVSEQKSNEVIVEITGTITDSGNGDFRSTSGVPVETQIQLKKDNLYVRLREFIDKKVSAAGSAQ